MKPAGDFRADNIVSYYMKLCPYAAPSPDGIILASSTVVSRVRTIGPREGKRLPEIPTVAECYSCNSQFRVDKKLIEGYRAVQFRCRRCGNAILVGNPESQGIREAAFTASRPRLANARPVPFSPRSAGPRAMRGVAPRSFYSAELVAPAAGDAAPDNLVSIDPRREAECKPPACVGLDISGNSIIEIPYDGSAPRAISSPALPAKVPPVPAPGGHGADSYSRLEIASIMALVMAAAYLGFRLLLFGITLVLNQ